MADFEVKKRFPKSLPKDLIEKEETLHLMKVCRIEVADEIEKDTVIMFSTLMSSLYIPYAYEVCVADEACYASQLECFMRIVNSESFILAGYPYQLCAQEASLYEHLDVRSVILSTQYQISRSLSEFSNSYFYKKVVQSITCHSFQILIFPKKQYFIHRYQG